MIFGHKHEETPEPAILEYISKHNHQWHFSDLLGDLNSRALFICDCGAYKRVAPLVEVENELKVPKEAA